MKRLVVFAKKPPKNYAANREEENDKRPDDFAHIAARASPNVAEDHKQNNKPQDTEKAQRRSEVVERG